MKGLDKRELVLLVLVLLLAAVPRLVRLDLVEFKYDEAIGARGALGIVRGEHLPVVGTITSQGPRNLPLSQYLLALPFAIARDPRVAAAFVASLWVAAVFVTWWVARREFNPLVGLLAAGLFAASPWAVFFSRKIWSENQPLVTVLLFAALLAWAVRRRPWALAGALAAVGALLGFHLSGLALAAVVGLVVLLFLRQLRPLPLLVGIAAFLVFVGPYLLADARDGWANVNAFVELTQSEGGFSSQALAVASMVVGGWHIWDVTGGAHQDFLSALPPLWGLDLAESAVFWLGLAWLVVWVARRVLRERGKLEGEAAARLILLCWLGVGLLLQLRRVGSLSPHRFIPLYPAQYLVIALGVSDLWKTLRRSKFGWIAAGVGWLLLVVLVVWQVWVFQALMTFVENNVTPGGYGPPVRYALEAVDRAEELAAQAEGSELLVLLPGASVQYDEWAAVFDVLTEAEVRLIDGRTGLIVPPTSAVYLALPETEPAAEMLERIGVEAGPALPWRGGSERRYRLFVAQPASAVPTTTHAEPVRWSSGAQLEGYAWSGEPQPGGTINWTLYWRVIAPPPGDDLHWFNHLMDGEGLRWGQMDGAGVAASTWRVGDIAIAWFDIPISSEAPPAPYYVRSGHYVYPDMVGVPLVDEAGQPAGDFVELGPLE